MPLDASYAGKTYPPGPVYEVGREKIREFAAAVGADHPAHHDPEAAAALGHPDLVAPPTFPIVLTMPAGDQVIADPQLGLDYSRVVHGDQRFRYERPVHAGDRLRCVTAVEDVTSRAGHDFLTLRTEVATEAGEPVVTVWSRLVVRGEG
jgi:acyl dehydratase